MRRPLGLNDAKLLRELYEEQGASTAKIAELIGCSRGAVNNALRRNGIEIRPNTAAKHPPALDDKTWLLQRYVDAAMSASQIAEELGCSAQAVRVALDKHGVQRRSEIYQFAQLNNEQWLRARYVDENLTARSISELIGCSKPAVLAALRRHGIQARSGSFVTRYPQLKDPVWLRENYEQKLMNVPQIAKIVGCKRQSVRTALIRHGIEIRSSSESQRLAALMNLPDQTRAKLLDKNWLQTMYIDRSMSSPQIASLIECSDVMVRSALRRYGIPIRSTMIEAQRNRAGMNSQVASKLDDVNWMTEAYVSQRRPTTVIAEELGCSILAVTNALKRHGIKLRSFKEAGVTRAMAQRNGYDAMRTKRLRILAKDAGEVGKAYTQVIKTLGALDRVPHTGREQSRLEREAMDGLYKAQDALGQRLLLGSPDGEQ